MPYALNFTAADLDANRHGELTDAQTAALENHIKMRLHQSKWGIGITTSNFLFFKVVLDSLVPNNAGDTAQSMTLSRAIVTTLLLIGLGLIMVRASVWEMRRLPRARIRTFEGRRGLPHRPDGEVSLCIRWCCGGRGIHARHSNSPMWRHWNISERVWTIACIIYLILILTSSPPKKFHTKRPKSAACSLPYPFVNSRLITPICCVSRSVSRASPAASCV